MKKKEIVKGKGARAGSGVVPMTGVLSECAILFVDE